MISPRQGGIRILVVDDSPIDRRRAAVLIRPITTDVLTAEDGAAALEMLCQVQPDLIITDLQMPEMDGLQLVEEVRLRHPGLPTVLMTAHGSEELALRALKQGAASYVPKRSLADRLVDTVRDVLAASRTQQEQLRVRDVWSQSNLEFELDNDTALIPVLVGHLQQHTLSVRHCDPTELVRVGVALHEALRNAMHHGNLELTSELRQTDADAYYQLAERRRRLDPYARRRVHLSVQESRAQARYTIRDEGCGFDPASHQFDLSSPQHAERPSGRGLFLIRTFMDEVRFNAAGNEITLIHRRRVPEQDQAVSAPLPRHSG